MSFDWSLARCSFCARTSSEVRRMVAGPGAAYICDDCLQLCNEILHDATPFSPQALELASRSPVVVAAPQFRTQERSSSPTRNEPLRRVTLEMEQKQQGMTLILHQLHYYQTHFELHYLWIRTPLSAGFAFVPRIIFFAGLPLSIEGMSRAPASTTYSYREQIVLTAVCSSTGRSRE